jgi:hypothetical protein
LNRKLAALFTAIGIIGIGGTTYVALQLKDDATIAQAVDAGFNQAFDPVKVECPWRQVPQCVTRPDGGQLCGISPVCTRKLELPDGGARPRYFYGPTKAFVAERDGGGLPGITFPFLPKDNQGRACIAVVGDPQTACTLVEEGCTGAGCGTDSEGNQIVATSQDKCACRNPDAGLCRMYRYDINDGGFMTLTLAPLGLSLDPGFFVGPGCVRKSCMEIGGEQSTSWPAECPLP